MFLKFVSGNCYEKEVSIYSYRFKKFNDKKLLLIVTLMKIEVAIFLLFINSNSFRIKLYDLGYILEDFYFLPKSAGISPQALVSHFKIGFL